jgi:cell wall-associated NlpC family hydrolase
MFSLLVLLLCAGCSSTVRFSSTPSKSRGQKQLPTTPPPEAKINPGIATDNVTRECRSFLGTPYHYGGVSEAGLDCSGLVCLVFKKAGEIVLPHSSKKLRTLGRKISLAQARPGDLLFFKAGYLGGVNHVGVYIGNGRFIHASTKLGVIESGMDDEYYRSRFVEVRRLIK